MFEKPDETEPHVSTLDKDKKIKLVKAEHDLLIRIRHASNYNVFNHSHILTLTR